MNRFKQFQTRCACGGITTKKFAREHGGKCKQCVDPTQVKVRDNDTYHDWVASGARAAGVSFSDC
jgi:hypothetical protein